MHSLDIAILRTLMHATAPMPAKEIAEAVGMNATDNLVRSRIRFLRGRGFEIVNWSGRLGGYIHPGREDLLYPVTVGIVVAECYSLAARRALH